MLGASTRKNSYWKSLERRKKRSWSPWGRRSSHRDKFRSKLWFSLSQEGIWKEAKIQTKANRKTQLPRAKECVNHLRKWLLRQMWNTLAETQHRGSQQAAEKTWVLLWSRPQFRPCFLKDRGLSGHLLLKCTRPKNRCFITPLWSKGLTVARLNVKIRRHRNLGKICFQI